MSAKGSVPEKVESGSNSPSHPSYRYVGFALLLAWHYNLWFLHDSFVGAQLLDDCVTQSWLIALVAAGISFLAIPIVLNRKRHLSDIPWLHWTATGFAVGSTAILTLLAFTFPTDLISYGLAVIVGVTNAILWIMWGELYSRTQTTFQMGYIATTVGFVMFVSSLICYLLPSGVSSVLISLMPLGAAILYAHGENAAKDLPYPTLLPKSTAHRAFKPMIVVCDTTFVAAAACYFLVAIIPWDTFAYGDSAFTFGSMGGALLLLLIGGICALTKERLNIYRIFPWLIVLAIIAFAVFLMGSNQYNVAFYLILAVVAVFEILLVMYFGVLGVKGYVPVAFAFGFSGAFIRLGIALGNSIALVYEAHPEFAIVGTEPTSLIFVCILAAIVIPLVRQEYNITQLMAPPSSESTQEQRIKELAAEFSLSARETEIVTLIARGFTTDNVAKKLYISPYTVNTHIRHVYEKVGIHKRSELIDYINRHGSDKDD